MLLIPAPPFSDGVRGYPAVADILLKRQEKGLGLTAPIITSSSLLR